MSRHPRWLLLVAAVVAACALPASAQNTGSQPITLIAMVGPDFDITLKTSAGTNVKHLPAGTYRIVVTDRTGDDSHNFHLKGFRVDRATGVRFVGTRIWTVRFTRGKLYRFVCDPHAFAMKGSFRVD